MGLGQRRDHVGSHAALDEAHVHGDARLHAVQGMQRQNLACQRIDGAGALGRVDARVGGHALHLEVDAVRALALVHHVAADAPGLGVEHGARALHMLADHRAARGRAHFFIAGEQEVHGQRVAAKARQGLGHEHVHHQAGLHVRHAGAEGLAAVHAPGALGGGAQGKDGVHVAHQLPMPLSRWVAARHAGQQAVAPARLRQRLHGDACGFEPRTQQRGHLAHAGLVAAAAVDVHDLGQQIGHGLLLGGQPVQQGAGGVVDGRGGRGHGRCCRGAGENWGRGGCEMKISRILSICNKHCIALGLTRMPRARCIT